MINTELEEEVEEFRSDTETTPSESEESVHSVVSVDLFKDGKDEIILEGELYKFKPGISQNFIPRYVQISHRAFRYFKNRYEAGSGKPIVAFRKKIIKAADNITVNKNSYLKPGSAIAQKHTEDHLFENMFEVLLHEDYEDNYDFRHEELAIKEYEDRKKFEQDMGVKKVTTKSGKQLYKSTTKSNYSSRSKSSQDKDEDTPKVLRPPKLDTKSGKKKFNKLGTFTFGDNSPYRSS